jgi:hypothetical protein
MRRRVPRQSLAQTKRFCSHRCQVAFHRQEAAGTPPRSALVAAESLVTDERALTLPPPSVTADPPRIFKVYIGPHITAKAPCYLDGELIGNWFAPLYRAAAWLLENGRAVRSDIIETWREGRGAPDYILDHMPIGRAANCRIVEGEEIHLPEGEGPRAALTERAPCPYDYRLLKRINSGDDDEALAIARGFYERGMESGIAGKTGPSL